MYLKKTLGQASYLELEAIVACVKNYRKKAVNTTDGVASAIWNVNKKKIDVSFFQVMGQITYADMAGAGCIAALDAEQWLAAKEQKKINFFLFI